MKNAILILANLFFVLSICVAQSNSKVGDTGKFKDEDGQEYGWKKNVDGKVWMTDNLMYASEKSQCINTSKCGLGRFYPREEAQTVCPTGWRLPTTDEYRALVQAVDGKTDDVSIYRVLLGTSLNAKGIGYGQYGGFNESSKDAYFWATNKRKGVGQAYYNENYKKGFIEETVTTEKWKFNVRCVQE